LKKIKEAILNKLYLAAGGIAISLILIVSIATRDSVTTSCARLAANPEENIKDGDESIGVAFAKIDKPNAINVCRNALTKDENKITKYHLARALLSGTVSETDLAEAKDLINQSINEGYVFAHLGAGYIAYKFKPGDGLAAVKHYDLAFAAGATSGRIGAAQAKLFSQNTQHLRTEGEKTYMALAKFAPSLYVDLSTYYSQQSKTVKNAKAAEQMLLLAHKGNVKQAAYLLTRKYAKKKSPLYNVNNVRKWAQIAIKNGYKAAYSDWIDSYYRHADAKRYYKKALEVATKASAANHTYGSYIAGFMHYNGQGTPKNSLIAETHLKKASAKGHKPAEKLLKYSVSPRANQLRNLPKYSAQGCVKSRVSRYDRSNIDYYNGCKTTLNTISCSRSVATEFFSLFDRKDRTTCRRKTVTAGKYITNFYGANKNSSLLRKAVSNTNVRVGACHPPLKPQLNGSKVTCSE
jgi:TPR repeat protein